MKISSPRREIYKQEIRTLMASQPRIDNCELAQHTGLHRNTITKLLEEIRIDNEQFIRERWKMLLNDVTEHAQTRINELNKLWAESYRSLYHSKPSQLVGITKLNWTITQDLYRMHLEYMGIRQNPKTLVQVNVSRNVLH